MLRLGAVMCRDNIFYVDCINGDNAQRKTIFWKINSHMIRYYTADFLFTNFS